jgi:hypothetical protein
MKTRLRKPFPKGQRCHARTPRTPGPLQHFHYRSHRAAAGFWCSRKKRTSPLWRRASRRVSTERVWLHGYPNAQTLAVGQKGRTYKVCSPAATPRGSARSGRGWERERLRRHSSRRPRGTGPKVFAPSYGSGLLLRRRAMGGRNHLSPSRL